MNTLYDHRAFPQVIADHEIASMSRNFTALYSRCKAMIAGRVQTEVTVARCC